jgi:hypothetical protein
MANKQ